MYPPNILLTNHCNQSCPFCFARKEMSQKAIDREMKLSDYELLLKKMKKNPEIKTVKLLGGEPTLHSRFEELIALTLKSFPSIHIFTNGMFPPHVKNYLMRLGRKVEFTFNVMTPGFLLNKETRRHVLSSIRSFHMKTGVTLSLTIDPRTDLKLIMSILPADVIRNVSKIRVGFSNPISGEKNAYQFSDFPRMGGLLLNLVWGFKAINPKMKFSLNCGFTRCMFTDDQYRVFKNLRIEYEGWGCFGKASSMDVSTNMRAFHCFPLSTRDRISVRSGSLEKVNAKLLLSRYKHWQEIYLKVCKKCPFFGHEKDKCPGPCIAFRLNI